MPRKPPDHAAAKFATEADLCAAFISALPERWTAYAEWGGFDILLAGPGGVQIGIEAKLALNAKVIDQVLPPNGSWCSPLAPSPVVMVERESFAIAHLVAAIEAGLVADCPIWTDAKTFDGRPWRGLVDGLIGGIPCQPHSVAGKRLGRDDPRDLWGAARRIIVQSGAWFVLIENVAGMLSSGGARRVHRDLQRLGFAVEGGLFKASEVGAPQERERLFILAVADPESREGREGRGLAARPRRERHGDADGRSAAAVADAGGAGPQGAERRGSPVERDGPAPSRPAPELRGAPVGDPLRRGHDGDQGDPLRGSERRAADARAGGGVGGSGLADPDEPELRRQSPAGQLAELQRHHGEGGGVGLFPPGPSDLDAWRSVLAGAPELEPAVRSMADGLAANRTDWLRLLGNGVVPLQAAYGVRTLADRLAARGAPGADRLVQRVTP